jgi:hypothetical protein
MVSTPVSQALPSGATTPSTAGISSTKPSTPVGTVSRQQSMTPATTTVPSILETSLVQDEIRNHDAQAEALKSSNLFHKRVLWAAGDKKLIYEKIQELQNGNEQLESLSVYKVPERPMDSLGLPEAEIPVRDLSVIQTSVKSLHDALAALDEPNGEKRLKISMQLIANPQSLSEELPEDHDLYLREN